MINISEIAKQLFVVGSIGMVLGGGLFAFADNPGSDIWLCAPDVPRTYFSRDLSDRQNRYSIGSIGLMVKVFNGQFWLAYINVMACIK